MRLYYYQDPRGNFGDDLNPWIWGRLFPEIIDGDPGELFVGIGTLLSDKLPPAPMKHIFGSGMGYGRPPAIDSRFRFHAVRGYETARKLGIGEELVITDPAVLVRTIVRPPPPRRHGGVGLMLTAQALYDFDWSMVCAHAGMRLISCHQSVDSAIDDISRCNVLLTEAMHGAIVADALRVPWIPVTCNVHILGFKWRDWLSSLRMQYEPTHITPLFDVDRNLGLLRRLCNVGRRIGAQTGLRSSSLGKTPPRRSGPDMVDRTVRELEAASKRQPFLSDESLLASHTARYVALVEQLRRESGHHAA